MQVLVSKHLAGDRWVYAGAGFDANVIIGRDFVCESVPPGTHYAPAGTFNVTKRSDGTFIHCAEQFLPIKCSSGTKKAIPVLSNNLHNVQVSASPIPVSKIL